MIMENFGARAFASPSNNTHYGSDILVEDPDSPGSLGMAISEAVEAAASSGGTKKYSLGSVLNHVLMHQTVIGIESLQQMDMAAEYSDIVIGCARGGSNFAYPFSHKNLTEGKHAQIIAVEPPSCPTMTKGVYAFDDGDTAAMASRASSVSLWDHQSATRWSWP